ncbi:MAG: iron-containing alcohol dehydrogenase, partial [Pseudomonadales bacterium]|nr:iron-containing alcohol dehydrogenase [Pseudomonadales bacterium]
LSRAASAQTDAHATTAVRLIFKHLLTTYESPNDLVARDAMAMAAFYAGLAFGRTSVGYVHGIAHQLGRFCGTPHGNANAMGLPEVLAAYGDCVHARLAQLAQLVEVAADESTEQGQATRFIEAIAGLRAQMAMPTRPEGLQREQLPTIVDAALAEAGSLYPVPRYMSAQELSALVEPLLAS